MFARLSGNSLNVNYRSRITYCFPYLNRTDKAIDKLKGARENSIVAVKDLELLDLRKLASASKGFEICASQLKWTNYWLIKKGGRIAVNNPVADCPDLVLYTEFHTHPLKEYSKQLFGPSLPSEEDIFNMAQYDPVNNPVSKGVPSTFGVTRYWKSSEYISTQAISNEFEVTAGSGSQLNSDREDDYHDWARNFSYPDGPIKIRIRNVDIFIRMGCFVYNARECFGEFLPWERLLPLADKADHDLSKIFNVNYKWLPF